LGQFFFGWWILWCSTQSGDHHAFIGRFSQIWLQAKYEKQNILLYFSLPTWTMYKDSGHFSCIYGDFWLLKISKKLDFGASNYFQ
jgi:hypothetical protein